MTICLCCQIGNDQAITKRFQLGGGLSNVGIATLLGMVLRIRRGARPHLYIEEHMAHRGLSDEKLANRMNVGRTTVWRWRKQQHRLNPQKIDDIAHHIGLESGQDLYRPPERPSIDAIMADASSDDYEIVLEMARRIIRRAS